MVSVPWSLHDGAATAFKRCVRLALINGVYYMRAMTEEAHMLRDPAYVEYYNAVQRRYGLPVLPAAGATGGGGGSGDNGGSGSGAAEAAAAAAAWEQQGEQQQLQAVQVMGEGARGGHIGERQQLLAVPHGSSARAL
jgi:hypothetical protein